MSIIDLRARIFLRFYKFLCIYIKSKIRDFSPMMLVYSLYASLEASMMILGSPLSTRETDVFFNEGNLQRIERPTHGSSNSLSKTPCLAMTHIATSLSHPLSGTSKQPKIHNSWGICCLVFVKNPLFSRVSKIATFIVMHKGPVDRFDLSLHRE